MKVGKKSFLAKYYVTVIKKKKKGKDETDMGSVF